MRRREEFAGSRRSTSGIRKLSLLAVNAREEEHTFKRRELLFFAHLRHICRPIENAGLRKKGNGGDSPRRHFKRNP